MDILSLLANGFAVALTPQNLFLALLGCFLGTLMGALPGLGPANGVAILIKLNDTVSFRILYRGGENGRTIGIHMPPYELAKSGSVSALWLACCSDRSN